MKEESAGPATITETNHEAEVTRHLGGLSCLRGHNSDQGDQLPVNDLSRTTFGASNVIDFANTEGDKTSRPAFSYEPLDESKSEIRLVTLKPGDALDPIECTLRTVSLQEADQFQFKALSYVWGPPEPSKNICVQGFKTQIGENLWQALYHLRARDTGLDLWIDAICINQGSIPEKNYQVPLMGAIYNIAADVLVWLGPAHSRSDPAMKFMARDTSSDANKKTQLPEDFTSRYSRELHGLRLLMDREYWHRTWIIQELLKAKTFTVHCGHQQLLGTLFEDFFRQVRDRLRVEQYLSTLPISPETRPSETLKFLSKSRAARHMAGRQLISNSRSLEEILDTYRDSLSTKPCDLVYSLIGLTNSKLCRNSVAQCSLLSSGAIVDYSRSDLELFQTLIWEFHSEEPGSAIQVKRMKALQKSLRLSLPSLNWLNMKGPGPNDDQSQCGGDAYRITSLARSYGKVLACGPYWSWNSERMEHVSDLIDWYVKLVNSRDWLRICFPPWHDDEMESLLENDARSDEPDIVSSPIAMEEGNSMSRFPEEWLRGCLKRLTNQDMWRLGVDPDTGAEPNVQIFADTRGRIGVGRVSIRENDQLIEFEDTDVILATRRTRSSSIVGRALLFGKNVGESGFTTGAVTDESITLPLEHWQSLIW